LIHLSESPTNNIADELRNEIARLNPERTKLLAQRAELDSKIAALDMRLNAARQYLSTLEPAARYAPIQRSLPRPRMRAGRRAKLSAETRLDMRRRAMRQRKTRAFLDDLSADQLAALDTAGLTLDELRATNIPPILGRRRLHQNSKKATIIRAVKAFLLKNSISSRSELTSFLISIGILGTEKNPENSLGVILSEAKQVFESEVLDIDGVRFVGWFLTELHAEGTM
jgi:hypothetical protein